MEIEVIVEYESIIGKHFGEFGPATAGREKAVDAFFTYVSIDNNGKALAVPSLVVNSTDCCFILCANIDDRHIQLRHRHRVTHCVFV